MQKRIRQTLISPHSSSSCQLPHHLSQPCSAFVTAERPWPTTMTLGLYPQPTQEDKRHEKESQLHKNRWICPGLPSFDALMRSNAGYRGVWIRKGKKNWRGYICWWMRCWLVDYKLCTVTKVGDGWRLYLSQAPKGLDPIKRDTSHVARFNIRRRTRNIKWVHRPKNLDIRISFTIYISWQTSPLAIMMNALTALIIIHFLINKDTITLLCASHITVPSVYPK